MERKKGVFHILEVVEELIDKPSKDIPNLRKIMEAHDVLNSKDLYRSVRSALAKEVFINYKNAKGHIYNGDESNLKLWFVVGRYLGPDSLADAAKEGLIDRIFMGVENKSRSETHLSSEEMFNKRINDLVNSAIKEGWKQDEVNAPVDVKLTQMTTETNLEPSKESKDEPKVYFVIDTEDEFPGIAPHLDFSLFDTDGNFMTHATFAQNTSPQAISEWLIRMADVLEQKGLGKNSPDSFSHVIETYRLAAKQVPGLTPDEGGDFSVNALD